MIKRALPFALGLLGAAVVHAQDLYTPFQALPAETVFAFRVDNSSEVRERYMQETLAGRVLLSDERVARFKSALRRALDETEEGQEFEEGLHSVGLALEDLYSMLSSSFGGALVFQPIPNSMDMPTVLLWAEMEDGYAAKLVNALRAGAESEETMEREDIDLGGIDASRIRNLSNGDSFLIARLDNRAFFGIGLPVEPMDSPERSLVFEEAEANVLGYFVHAQREGDGGFLSRFHDDPGIASARPNFEPQIEAMGDVNKLMQFASPENLQLFKALEFDKLTNFAVWSGLHEGEATSIMFVGAPQPRTGFVSLIDQEAFLFSPPPWVPATVRGYASLSFNVRDLYEVMVDSAKRMGSPEMVELQLDQANQQLRETLQTDIDTILSSIGSRVHVLTYPLRVIDVTVGETSVEVPQSPQAIVVDFGNTELLQSALNAAVSLGAGAFEPFEEQGFSGVRMEQADGEVALAYGLGKLIFTKGDDLASQVFSALANPPAGENALINDPSFRSFVREVDPRPGIGFSYENGAKAWENLDSTIEFIVEIVKSNLPEDAAAIVDEFREAVPEEEELKNLIGYMFARVYTTERGLIIDGSSQYR